MEQLFDLGTYLDQVAPALPSGDEPMHDEVFVLPLKEQDHSAGGLLIAEEHRDPPMRGVVLAVGPGAWADNGLLMPMGSVVGDVVSYGKYAGEPFKVSGLAVIIARDRELKVRRPRHRYTLVRHLIKEGAPDARYVYHESEDTCDLCERPVSDLIAAERARLVAQQNASLHDESPAPSVHEDHGDADPVPAGE